LKILAFLVSEIALRRRSSRLLGTDRMSIAMSALEMAKLAGSTVAASGGSLTRRRSHSRNSRRSSRSAARKPAWKNRSRCAGFALHGALKQRISVRHLAAFQNENSANEPQKSKFANMLLATEISAHDVAARTVLREGAAVTRWRSGAPLFQRPALPSSALLSRIDCGWIAARLRDRHNGDFDRKVAEAALGAAVCPADPNALKC
jgi:hypothetical protein